jgi:hypothetical protein
LTAWWRGSLHNDSEKEALSGGRRPRLTFEKEGKLRADPNWICLKVQILTAPLALLPLNNVLERRRLGNAQLDAMHNDDSVQRQRALNETNSGKRWCSNPRTEGRERREKIDEEKKKKKDLHPEEQKTTAP